MLQSQAVLTFVFLKEFFFLFLFPFFRLEIEQAWACLMFRLGLKARDLNFRLALNKYQARKSHGPLL